MKIKETLKKGILDLKTADIETPALEAGVLLCHVLGCERGWIYTHGDEEMEEADLRRFCGYVEERCKGTPLQYITSHQEFMSLDFTVTPHVLIPRQDTEVLVETVIRYAEEKGLAAGQGMNSGQTEKVGVAVESGRTRILDIGTGSGCIAVSLAYYLPNSRVWALDISCKALDIARDNAAKAGVADRMEFVCGDLFEGLQGCSFDVIVSNPPYIPSREIAGLKPEVREHEPYNALDGGMDGLDFYRRITEESPGYLEPAGLLVFEVGIGQAGDVAAMMRENFTDIFITKDLAGISRVVGGRLKK